jgi:protein TonB
MGTDNNSENVAWDDMVFENRNKDYGAYVVRQGYNENLAKGLYTSLSIAMAMVFVPLILSSFLSDPVIDVEEVFVDDTIVITQPPVIEPVVPPQQKVVSPPPAAPNLAVQVTTEPVNTEPPTNAEINTALTTSVETGGTPGTVDIGQNTLAEPPVVEPETPTGPINFAEVMPAYEGGLEALYRFVQRKVHYPAGDRRIGVEGTVYVSFVVNRNGDVVDVKTIKGISASCDKEAERVISMLAKWTPGMQHHRPVSVRMTLPIKFQIDN